jgi:hypothetical protein
MPYIAVPTTQSSRLLPFYRRFLYRLDTSSDQSVDIEPLECSNRPFVRPLLPRGPSSSTWHSVWELPDQLGGTEEKLCDRGAYKKTHLSCSARKLTLTSWFQKAPKAIVLSDCGLVQLTWTSDKRLASPVLFRDGYSLFSISSVQASVRLVYSSCCGGNSLQGSPNMIPIILTLDGLGPTESRSSPHYVLPKWARADTPYSL